MKTVPTSARDMWWAEQQKAEHGITIEYTNHIREGEEKKPGMLSDVKTIVKASKTADIINVVECKSYLGKQEKNGWWSIKQDDTKLAVFTFEEFKKSKWWDSYLTKVGSGFLNFDSSWMDSFSVESGDDYATVEFDMPTRKSVWWCSADIPTGNTVKCTLEINDSGGLYLEYGFMSYQASISDFIRAIKAMKVLERAGVEINGESELIVKLHLEDEVSE